MKKSIKQVLCLGTVALNLVLTLGGCGSSKEAGIPGAGSLSPSASQPFSQSPSEPDSETPLTQTGRVLALGDPRLVVFPADLAVATQQELDRWNHLIGSGTVAKLEVCNMNSAETPLSADQISGVLKTLMGADLKLYETLGNPTTGGTIHVIAYDAADAVLFHVRYDGEWFSAAMGEEKTAWIFNGAGTSLDRLAERIPE